MAKTQADTIREQERERAQREQQEERVISRGLLITGLPGGPLTGSHSEFASDVLALLKAGNSTVAGAKVSVVDTIEYHTPAGHLGELAGWVGRDY